jgi:hypothetical protein
MLMDVFITGGGDNRTLLDVFRSDVLKRHRDWLLFNYVGGLNFIVNFYHSLSANHHQTVFLRFPSLHVQACPMP